MFRPRVLRGPLRRALVLENPDPSLDGLLEASGFEVRRVHATPDKAGMLELVREFQPHLLFKRSRLEIDAEILEAAEDLFAVMLCCIGDDSVDKEAAAARGILVLNDPRSNGRSVAELVIGELISGARRLPELYDEARHGRWSKSASGRYELKGKNLGILGLGHIGKQVARLAEGLGMHVLFHDADEAAQAVGETFDWAGVRSVEELFAQSDFLTVHVSPTDPADQSNEGLITRELLMSLGSERGEDCPRVFLNLARGFLLEADDLIDAVRAGAVQQAFVDVYADEPHAGEETWANPYADLPQVHCTPHIGAATRDAQPRIARKMARTARLYSQRGTVEDCVFAPKRRIEASAPPHGATILTVVHANVRGTKKALDQAIFAADRDNLESSHRDFSRAGIAYEISVLDSPLDDAEIAALVAAVQGDVGRSDAVRAVRQVEVP